MDEWPGRHFCNFANAPKNYICISMLNFSTDSLEIWSRFKKLKITFVWKHEYSCVINGCPEVRIIASFSVIIKEALMTKDFFINLMAKCFSHPSDVLSFASTTLPKPPSPKILIGWKLFMENFGRRVPALVWPETQSFNVLLRHRIYRCYNYNTIICCSWWWWWWW